METTALTLLPDHPQRMPGNAFLRFHITPDIQAVLPMPQVQEVLSLPAQRLTAIPNMPPSLLGLMNRRSRALWAADLSHILRLPGYEANRRTYDLAIIRTDTIALALAVHQINGLYWLPPDSIEPPPGQVPPSLQAYLRGCTIQQQAIWLVLDANAIAQSARLRQD